MKTPTPKEINATNAEFWKAEREKLPSRIEEYPDEAREAAALVAKLMRAGLGSHPEFLHETSLEASMAKVEANAARLRKRDQSTRAKKPRPGKRPTLKSETIAAMRKARKEGQTLDEFLASAQAGSVEGVEIKPADTQEVARFWIVADKVSEEEKQSKRTPKRSKRALEDWWSEAGKPATTK